jgi:two-component system response regulator AdeR
MTEDRVVLVVEDDEGVAETFRMWLEKKYEVYVALRGSEAFELLEEKGIDVVLLDRLMPGLSGDEVLERIRDEGFDCRVAMVTAVEPDFDIIRMGFDDYVTKPSSPDELRQTVEKLIERDERSEKRREYASLRARQATLEAEKGEAELANSDEYDELVERAESLGRSLDEDDEELTQENEFLTSLRDIEGETE